MFPERLQAAMESRALTQGQLEHKTEVLGQKVSQSYISRILKEKQEPSLLIAVMIARALDVSLDWLVGLPRREKEPLEPDAEEVLHLYESMGEKEKRTWLVSLRVWAAGATEKTP